MLINVFLFLPQMFLFSVDNHIISLNRLLKILLRTEIGIIKCFPVLLAVMIYTHVSISICIRSLIKVWDIQKIFYHNFETLCVDPTKNLYFSLIK